MAHDVVHRLYEAFAARDGQSMQDCYADDAAFRDPVFNLSGRTEIGAMWKMLIERGSDLELQIGEIVEDSSSGSAHWEATYTFGATGRPVHNVVNASFVIADGQIAYHLDEFSFWRWSRQALGPIGLLLGWTRRVHEKLQAEARKSLDRYLESLESP